MNAGLPQNTNDIWNIVPLRSLCLKTGTTNPSKNSNLSFEYVDVSAISNELWKIMATTQYTGATAPSRARKLVQKQDVIFATVRPTLKRVAVVPDRLDGQIVSTAFCVLRSDPKKADPCFIYYSLLTNDFISRMENLQRGASYPAVTDSDVLDQMILAPPLPEQQAIADVLSKIQAAMEVQDKIVAILKELKAATMAKLFRKGLHGEPLKQTEIGEMPESWEVVKLGDICSYTTGKLNSEMAVKNGAYPFFTCSQETFRINSFSFDQEALLLAGNNAQGKYSVKYYKGKFDAYQRTYALTIKEQSMMDYQFLLHELTRKLELLRRNSLGATTKYLTAPAILNLLVTRPIMQEQRDIAKILSIISEELEAALTKRNHINSIFSSMLHLLMTGQVRVDNLRF